MLWHLFLLGSGEVYIWGSNEQGELGLTDRKHVSLPELVRGLEIHRKRAVAVTCGFVSTGVIVAQVVPSWSELKPLLVGWLKDDSCCFHHSKGLPIHILQYIIELAWAELPAPLVISV